MVLLHTFANAEEAAVIQSLLEAEGIVTNASDSRIEFGGVMKVRIFVDESELGKARELVGSHLERRKAEPPEIADPHPAEGYPFVGVVVFVGLLWMTVTVGLMLYALSGVEGRLLQLLQNPQFWGHLIMQILLQFFYGCLLGCVTALSGMVVRVVWRRFNPKPRS